MVGQSRNSRIRPLPPSRCSFIVPVCSIPCRPVSHFCRGRAGKSLRVEVMLVQGSLHPPPLPALRVAGGHVALALPRHFEFRFLQRGNDIGAAVHDAVLYALHQVVPDQLAPVGLDRQIGSQVRDVDVGAVAGPLHCDPRGVVSQLQPYSWLTARSGPKVFCQPGGAILTISRSQPGDEGVRVNAAAALAVLHGRPRVAIRLEPGPSRLLELVEHGLDLRVGGPVLRRTRARRRPRPLGRDRCGGPRRDHLDGIHRRGVGFITCDGRHGARAGGNSEIRGIRDRGIGRSDRAIGRSGDREVNVRRSRYGHGNGPTRRWRCRRPAPVECPCAGRAPDRIGPLFDDACPDCRNAGYRDDRTVTSGTDVGASSAILTSW